MFLNLVDRGGGPALVVRVWVLARSAWELLENALEDGSIFRGSLGVLKRNLDRHAISCVTGRRDFVSWRLGAVGVCSVPEG